MTSFPVLPLRDIVVFPHMIVPLFVGRKGPVTAMAKIWVNHSKFTQCVPITINILLQC